MKRAPKKTSNKKKTQPALAATAVATPAETHAKPGFFRRLWNWTRRRKWSLILVILAAVGAAWYFGGAKQSEESKFATANITRGDLHQVVTATGQISPVNTVSVGSQVSGNIEKIFVDFNSKVKKGDVLLTIDPTVLQAAVDEAKATLVSAQSQLTFAKNDFERNKSLFNDGFIARSEMEQSQTNFETAAQNVKKAQSQYDRAVTSLGYATIVSPVDGTVISRKVDEGQTVAASFQTPDLFEIAEDLTRMQIETQVSEADIGMVKEGQKVTFTVDAYPKQTFAGDVLQIRLSPTTTSNVVVYTVVISVDNPDLRLMPGMTAFVTIDVETRTDVFKAPNSAFLLRSFDGIAADAGDKKPREYLAVLRGADKTPILVPFKKGLITATETEIISDGIQAGDKIITGLLGQKSTATGGQQMGNRSGGPMGGGGMGGGGGGRRG